MTAKLPAKYAYLLKEPGPRLITEALKTYGIYEWAGKDSNPEIIRWAKASGLAKAYTADSIPWCGLWMTYVALQAGWQPPGVSLWALNWAKFGTGQPKAMLGDVLVFKRKGGGHVALYVGEDQTHYHILGGNQNDQVSITRRPKKTVYAIRRCPWRVNQPANVRKIYLTPSGTLAGKET